VTESILVVNAGSSSIKFQLFSVAEHDELQRSLKGQIEGIGVRPRLIAKEVERQTPIEEEWPGSEVATVPRALDKLVAFLRARLGTLPTAIGHRVVHGGPDFSEPTVIDDAVIERLEKFAPLAPLHQPNNLAPIRAVRARQEQLLQVACFDTAFHRNHPEIADRYALPEQLYAEGVRRYGFHGLSYEYIAGRLPEIAPEIASGRVIVAHLGSGASMCAIFAGKSVESTLGFTALDGLPMGTRPGQLDPGIMLYLMSEKRMSAKEIERLLYHESGLKGLSGISNDVRDLLASPDARAKLALDHFVYLISLFCWDASGGDGGIDGLFSLQVLERTRPASAKLQPNAWLGPTRATKRVARATNRGSPAT
jgi:acetate kinase